MRGKVKWNENEIVLTSHCADWDVMPTLSLCMYFLHYKYHIQNRNKGILFLKLNPFIFLRPTWYKNYVMLIFFNVGPPKEDIFFDHLLWSVFRSLLHIKYFFSYFSTSPCEGRQLSLLFTLLPGSVVWGLHLPGSPDT